MPEIPIIVSQDELIVAGSVEEIVLQLEVGAEGDRGAIFFTGIGPPPDVPNPAGAAWGNVTQFRIGDLYLQTDSVTGETWNYKNKPGGPQWEMVFQMNPSGQEPGEGGVTDHGALTGLTDDDHHQYLNYARGDARYPAIALVNQNVTSGSSPTFNAAHFTNMPTHGQLAGLVDDDHMQYHNDARGDARYPAIALVDQDVSEGSSPILDAARFTNMSGGGGSSEFLYILVYGGNFDGITDNSEAIDSALAVANAWASVGGIYFPPGTWIITRSINLDNGLSLVGAGQYKTLIKTNTQDIDLVTATDAAYVMIERISFQGPGKGVGTGRGIAFHRSAAAALTYYSIKDVRVMLTGGDGVYINQPIVSVFESVISQEAGGHGFNIHGTPAGAAGTSLQITACYANGCDGDGFNISKMAYTSLSACAADSCNIGYNIEACSGITLTGCGFEFPLSDGMFFKDCSSATIADGFCYMQSGVAIRSNWSRLMITGFSDIDPAPAATHTIVSENDSQVMVGALYRFSLPTLGDITFLNNTAQTWFGTEAEYDALGSYDPDSLYVIR